MWQCNRCGSNNENEFCGNCGYKRPDEDAPTFAGAVSENPYANGQFAGQQYAGQQYSEQQYSEQQYSEQQYTDGQYGQAQYTEGQYQGYTYDNGAYNPYASGEGYMPTPAEPMYEETDKPKSNKALWIVCIVLALLLVVVGTVSAFLIIGNDSKKSSRSDSSYEDESEEEEIVEETDEEEETNDKKKEKDKDKKTSTSKKTDIMEIEKDIIEEIINENSDYTDFNIYVKNMTNGYEFHYNDKASVLASAMSQIVILDTISDMEKNGDADCNNDEIFFTYFPNGKYAPLSPSQDGQYLSVISCIEDVAAYGDNNKSNALIDYIGSVYGRDGLDVIGERLRDFGYNKTKIIRKTDTREKIDDESKLNHTSAYDIGRIFENFIKNSSFGNKKRTVSMFRCVSKEEETIGLMNYLKDKYIAGNVNAFSNQTTNNVAYISDGKTELVVVILSNTAADKISVENNDSRDAVQRLIVDEIVRTQLK